MKFLENKIPPPLVAVIFALFMWVIATWDQGLVYPSPLTLLVIISFIAVGVTFTLSGAFAFKKANTTVNPLKPESSTSLVTVGVYQLSRNPMYVGFVCLLFAWAVFLGSPFTVLMIFAYIVYIQVFQITPEEKAMEKLFGDEFVNYKSRVRAWL